MADFEAEGLLEGLEGEQRDARIALLRELHDNRGASLEDLRRAVKEDRLVFLPSELMFGGPAKYTGLELAQRVGLGPEFLIAMRRALGLPASDNDERAYTEADVESAQTARAFRDLGLETADMLEITRILGHGFAQAAEAMRALVLKLALRPGTTEHDLALRYAEIASRLLPLTEPMLAQMLRLHLRHMARTEAISAAERESGRLPGARPVNVAFADLVGFTRMGEEVPADELGRVAGRLAELAGDIVEDPVRVVKMIGDAAMLTSPAGEPLLDSALALIVAADAEGEDFPQLRVGMACGPALSRAGDWYGRPVNLASRITAIARPGSVLVTGDVREATEEQAAPRFEWSFAGARRLKGVREPVPLFRARWARDADGQPGLGAEAGSEASAGDAL